MATKISVISREGPVDMLSGLVDGLLADLRSEGVGRVSAIAFTIDADRGRAIVDLVGEACEGEIVLRIFTGERVQESVNSWIAEEGLGDLKTALVRAEGRAYLLLVGRKV
jgi:hypothetical protein